MNFLPQALPEVILVEPDVYSDDRGFFLETHNERRYAEGGIAVRFVQDNHSRSERGILRGLHAQIQKPQGKLVRVVEGSVYDVAVDIRQGSPTFGKFVGTTLSAENFHQLYIPPGFAHGFCVTSESAQFEYKCTDFYDPTSEISVLWNDPAIGIPWPIDAPRLSEKDAGARRLGDFDADELPRYAGA